MNLELLHTTVGYIGPGGGMALLGPLLGVILAVLGSVLMIAIWPARAMIKRFRNKSKSNISQTPHQGVS